MWRKGFEKSAEQKQVAKAGIFLNGKYLMGVRQDTGKWTEPGGHLNPGESPLKGVAREVREETGLSIPLDEFKLLGAKEVSTPRGEKIKVHAYRADLKKDIPTTTKNDPDDEVFGWDWVPVKNKKLPSSVNKNLHVPAGKNVLHFFLGFEKSAFLRRLLRADPRHVKRVALDTPSQIAQSISQQEAYED